MIWSEVGVGGRYQSNFPIFLFLFSYLKSKKAELYIHICIYNVQPVRNDLKINKVILKHYIGQDRSGNVTKVIPKSQWFTKLAICCHISFHFLSICCHIAVTFACHRSKTRLLFISYRDYTRLKNSIFFSIKWIWTILKVLRGYS